MNWMPVVYVAGPYRAETAEAVKANILRASDAALEVWKLGAVALCPHKNTTGFDGAMPDESWLAGGVELVKRCDAILMVGNWRASGGSRREWFAALSLRLPVFENLSDLAAWLKSVAAPSCAAEVLSMSAIGNHP